MEGVAGVVALDAEASRPGEVTGAATVDVGEASRRTRRSLNSVVSSIFFRLYCAGL